MAEVPILWRQSSEPFVCGVVFRVGAADERVVTAGITHLIEHLSLPTRWPPEVDFNATVGRLYTDFWFAGPQRPALAMLSGLMHDLVNPPLERLARERSILRAEAAWRGWAGVYSHALYLRFGPAGPGMSVVPEYGLEWLGRSELREWIARAFCAANARAYMTARPPEAFRLELPRGKRMPAPALEPLPEVRLPAVFTEAPDGGAGISLLVERNFAARMLGDIAERRLRGLLRYRLGITYGGSHSYEPLDRQTAHLFLSADAQPQHVDAVRTGLLVVLDELAERGPTEQELARERQIAARNARNPHYLVRRLTTNACAELDGRRMISREDMVAGLSATTADDVSTAAAQALGTALLMLPARTTVPGGRFASYPLYSDSPVRGRRFAPTAEAKAEVGATWTLTVGSKGVSIDETDGKLWTVTFADCVARVRWGNGIELLSRDGTRLWIDPSRWEDSEAAVTKILAAKLSGDVDIDVRRRPPLFDDPSLVAGEQAYNEERWDDAIALLEQGLATAPNEAEAWCHLAWAYSCISLPTRAAAAAERAAELDPVDDWAPIFASQDRYEMGRVSEAVELAAEGLRRNPTSLRVITTAVHVFVHDGRIADATRLAERAVELFPEESPTWSCAGWVAQATGELGVARDAFSVAVELSPDAAMWHANLGEALLASGATEAALAAFDAVAERDPDLLFASRRVVALRIAGRAEDARAAKAQHDEAALRRARRAVASLPDDPDALAELARVLESSGDADALAEALETIKRAVALAASPSSLMRKARIELRLGDPASARRSLPRATRLAPDDGRVLRERARLAALAGDAADAATAADHFAIHREGSHALALVRLFALLADGGWKKALRAARAAMRVDPLDCCTRAAAGVALANLGRRGEARQAFEAANERSPGGCLTALAFEHAGSAAAARTKPAKPPARGR